MARNMNRGGAGVVYHWRHGWIPRTPTAALQKAHGSRKGASKLMDRHNIDGDLPGGGGKKADTPSTRATSSDGGAKSLPVGARVVARQPGIDNETHGRVVGHTDNGMVRVQYKDRRGNDVTGTFNPSHTRRADGQKEQSATRTPHSAPHTLKPGDRATVRGEDQYGQPMTLTGVVRSNGEQAIYTKGRTTGGRPVRAISIEREGSSGMTRQDVVYVPDPNRSEQRRGTAADREARNREQVARTRAAQPDAARQMDRITAANKVSGEKPKPSKKYVLERTLPDGTVKRHPEPMSPKQASLFASYSLHDNGAASKSDAQKVAKRLESLNVGESIEAGGYKMRLVEADASSRPKTRAEQLREAAAKKRAEADRIAGNAGVNDRAAAMLSGKTYSRQVARDDASLRRFAETRRQADALEARARSADARDAEAKRKDAAARLNLKPSEVSPGDLVVANGTPTLVQKVNKTTVSVPSVVGGSWDDRVELSKISQHIKVADLKDANLRVLHARARGAAKVALAAEMRRRGLSAA